MSLLRDARVQLKVREHSNRKQRVHLLLVLIVVDCASVISSLWSIHRRTLKEKIKIKEKHGAAFKCILVIDQTLA